MGPGAARPDDDETADTLLTPLGEFMQRRNAELGLSISDVARRVGMSRASWYRIARGESTSPGLHLLRGLARVYRVPAAEVFALAASIDAPAAPSPARHVGRIADAGDALWRCHHDRRHRPGALVEVRLELLNLSDRPWAGAEVRVLHPGWLHAPDAEAAAAPALVAADAPLPHTPPGDWVQARLALQAPRAKGLFASCLTLHLGKAVPSSGAGAFILIETA